MSVDAATAARWAHEDAVARTMLATSGLEHVRARIDAAEAAAAVLAWRLDRLYKIEGLQLELERGPTPAIPADPPPAAGTADVDTIADTPPAPMRREPPYTPVPLDDEALAATLPSPDDPHHGEPPAEPPAGAAARLTLDARAHERLELLEAQASGDDDAEEPLAGDAEHLLTRDDARAHERLELPDAQTEEEDDAPPATPDPLPSVSSRGPRTSANAARRRAAILAAYERHRGEWIGSSTIARETGELPRYVSAAAAVLESEGKLEHNGKQRAASRYRAPAIAAAPEPPPPPAETPTAAAQLSGRERRRRAAEERLGRDPDAPPDPDAGLTELERKAIGALARQPRTSRELARDFVVNLNELAPVLTSLETRNRLDCRGRRHGGIVYGVPGEPKGLAA